MGAPATVVFLAAEVPATIERVAGDGTVVFVRTENGDGLEFTLGRATGRWVTAAGQSGPRLRLAPDAAGG